MSSELWINIYSSSIDHDHDVLLFLLLACCRCCWWWWSNWNAINIIKVFFSSICLSVLAVISSPSSSHHITWPDRHSILHPTINWKELFNFNIRQFHFNFFHFFFLHVTVAEQSASSSWTYFHTNNNNNRMMRMEKKKQRMMMMMKKR